MFQNYYCSLNFNLKCQTIDNIDTKNASEGMQMV